jgi:hypothetical protein
MSSPRSVLDFYICGHCDELFYIEDAFMYDYCDDCQKIIMENYYTQDEGEQTDDE